ncbi:MULTISPECIES: class F sortase [unclassified Rathayibacter]|uniref:class F sortase n=1 Tax=unclassified Rathayibacter TaxID=2609250 RepID=UPI000F4D26AA|nr:MULTISPECIES: class F sortase [unclassified Rathayibacter]ROP50514.1 sortase family protein [Rathayibacter sp. PhB186]ROS53473.1 sortase family protein [Rathayibacter sp. PhB185]
MRRLAGAGAALAALLLLAGCASAGEESAPAATPASSAAPATTAPATPSPGDAGALQNPVAAAAPARSAVTPVRVVIPAIGVDSTLESLTRDDTGWIQPPVQVDEAGWYRDGVVPGDIGPSVIAGHVDSRIGPGVFLDLTALVPGDTVDVILSDGSTRTFSVTGSVSVPKEDFPTEDVYGPSPTPQLRLITCGGVFDDSYGHYVDNVVVSADRIA